ncbi:hypothetical protein SLEP1_g57606 [Rubroshorea leprosula]|uniref:Uncharacterized protein n=1 Tax=Rubroshorea leprosula TaxID=152421 RepID=A0AAV5MQ15_9ROSI|nr:hypothetical protein SLEP1_g57606 [Rubroshorea leprosula]
MDNRSRTTNWLCEGFSLGAPVPGLGASELVSQKCKPLKTILLSPLS